MKGENKERWLTFYGVMLLLEFEDLIVQYSETHHISWNSAHILCSTETPTIFVFSPIRR